MTCSAGSPNSFPCSFCQRYQPMAGDWEHGFGWSKCPACVRKPTCERCKKGEPRSGYRLCKKCNDDDDAAMMAAYMCCG